MSQGTTATKPSGLGAELAMAGAVLAILSIMVIPLPPLLLDMALAVSIAVSVMMLVISLGLQRAVDFSVFPSLLLLTTLFRLGLNIATTRLILLNGAQGSHSAGKIIETFGRFVIGGSVVVGVVVFLILLVVNFAVITKGSGRVSEVAARFTLDALPGKQMSIDADLGAGVIDDRQARERRSKLEAEAEFFGAMDGASKFVRGDAVAGLVITAINIVGGLAIGLFRDNLSLAQAVDTYTVLTVGDGLVSQIPALLVSTAAGIVVTRAAGADLATQVSGQLFARPAALQATAILLGFLALLPGMPFIPFATLAAGLYFLSRRLAASSKVRAAQAAAQAAGGGMEADGSTKQPEKIQDLLQLDALELEVGYGLLPLIDLAKSAELPGRVATLRKQLAADLGIVLPAVHLRDNLRLEANEYQVKLRGNKVAQGTAYADRLMALDPTGQTPRAEGISAREPAFGLPAVWILSRDRAAVEARGLTVVDPASMMTTHLSELLRKYAHEIVGRQEVQELLSVTAKEAPKLVEDVIPGTITLGDLVRVVRGLLREGLSVRDLRTILEAVADAAPRGKDPVFLVEQARRRLGRQITARVAGPSGSVKVITIDRALEEVLRASLGQSDGEPTLSIDMDVARSVLSQLEKEAGNLGAQGMPVVVLTSPDLRRAVFDFGSRFISDLWVISSRELAPGTAVESAGSLTLPSGGRAAA